MRKRKWVGEREEVNEMRGKRSEGKERKLWRGREKRERRHDVERERE